MQTFIQIVFVGCLVAAAHCPPSAGYAGSNYANVSSYAIDYKKGVKTPAGVLVVGRAQDTTASFMVQVDAHVAALDACLTKSGKPKVRREWFGVYVPSDWYTSTCSGEQVFPSAAAMSLCEAKGLALPPACAGVIKPNTACPCPCSFRANIQDNFWIVTAPNLKLFRSELLRLVTGVNNVWANETLRQACL